MMQRSTLAISVLLVATAAAAAADVELFVTDYNENPTPEQKAMVDRPLVYPAPAEVTIRPAGGGQPATYAKPDKVLVFRTAGAKAAEAKLFASLGEYEPFSFLLRPKQALQQVFIEPQDLQGPDGAVIAKKNLVVTSVEGFFEEGRRVLMPLGNKWNMGAHSTEFFWCTVHVPADAAAGTYRGQVVVSAEGKPVGAIDVVLEVLPVRLGEPPFALGFNYSNPKGPAALAAQLADMRAHGMTCVAPLYGWHLPVQDSNTAELGALLEAYKKAGFPATFYFATPMNLQLAELAGYGDETTRRWQQRYIKAMRLLHAETLKHDVPVLMSIGDELTNKGIDGVKIAERLARFVWEELPEIATTSDMNGYREVMAMAPYLNVATFNNGWDGIDHHNGGRQLINRQFIEELQAKTGAIPWFVNAASGRLPFGFFFWKMTKFGVRGKVEWYYCLENGKGSLTRTDGTTVLPTLDYERSREGVDDLKYLCRLEQLVAQATKAGKADTQRAAAEKLLKDIAASIQDDWSAYTSGGKHFPADGFEVMSPDKAVGLGELNTIRRALADRIVELQNAVR
jgi:hypothetical protein